MAEINDRSQHSVLVVDDTPSSRYAMARMLKAAGFNVVEAAGGAEALELVNFVSAVVLDVHLPDLLGFEVCRLLRGRRETANLPVIHVSAVYVQEADRATSAGSGADRYMVAPVDPQELTATLDQLISRRGAHPQRAG
jgi:DNA-binding response OmpR family regulator